LRAIWDNSAIIPRSIEGGILAAVTMYKCQSVKIIRDCLSPVRLLESEIMTDRMVAAVLRDFNDLRVEKILEALRGVGYDGTLIIEVRGGNAGWRNAVSQSLNILLSNLHKERSIEFQMRLVSH